MADENGKGKALGIGLLIGALAGVVAALLLAPKTGKETRQDLKRVVGLGRDKDGEKERAKDQWR